jgi:hypothetical protein
MVPFHDPLADEYRYCLYCEADCWPEPDNQRHGPECPDSTLVYPVDEPMLTFGARCECGHVFQRGDSYMHVEVARSGPDLVVVVVCVGCAARAVLLDGGAGS